MLYLKIICEAMGDKEDYLMSELENLNLVPS